MPSLRFMSFNVKTSLNAIVMSLLYGGHQQLKQLH